MSLRVDKKAIKKKIQKGTGPCDLLKDGEYAGA
jgi:hypothetical protein